MHQEVKGPSSFWGSHTGVRVRQQFPQLKLRFMGPSFGNAAISSWKQRLWRRNWQTWRPTNIPTKGEVSKSQKVNLLPRTQILETGARVSDLYLYGMHISKLRTKGLCSNKFLRTTFRIPMFVKTDQHSYKYIYIYIYVHIYIRADMWSALAGTKEGDPNSRCSKRAIIKDTQQGCHQQLSLHLSLISLVLSN